MRLTRYPYETHSQSYSPFASIFSYSKMMAKSLSNIKPLVYATHKVQKPSGVPDAELLHSRQTLVLISANLQ